MNHKSQIRRVLLLLFFVGAAFAGLGYRLVDLQVLRHDELAKLGDGNTHRDYWKMPRRGDILDINGNVLATSVDVKTVCADPTLIGGYQAYIAHALAPLLQMNEAQLYQKLLPRAYTSKDAQGQTVTNISHYVRLARDVPVGIWQKIQETMDNLTFGVDEKNLPRKKLQFFKVLRRYAVYAESAQMRSYPNGPLAAQVIGFTSTEESRIDGHAISTIVGRNGIELTMNSSLDGVPGWRVTETDRAHREMVSMRDQDVAARDGLDVVLTINSVLQHALEMELVKAMREHSPKSVTGIIVRPGTGEILAMATLPTFDPNNHDTISPETRNRAITDIIEPGSTFKIVVVSGALNQGVMKLTDTFDCEHGHFFYAGRTLHEAESSGFGILTAEQILTKSSNIGAAKIAIERLGADELYDYAWDYGFGQRTGIPLPGEARGILHPVKDWSKISIAQIPMGQGVAVTCLQMIMAMSAIANHGWLMRPMIVDRLQTHDGTLVQQYKPERVRQVVSDDTSRKMIEALETVPTKEGTAASAALKDYLVAGKTGTAEKVENGAYAAGKYVASFIGFFPADNPQVCISIVMNEPHEGHYGGQVCAPVFKDVAERCASYLNIPPNPMLLQTNALMAENNFRAAKKR